MDIHFVKLSEWRIPRKFLQAWLSSLTSELKKVKHDLSKKEITLVFVTQQKMTDLNREYRAKDKPTDILSFSGFEPHELGELVLCGEVVEQQALDHGLSVREELGYLVIHGVLHLLGYDHENGGQEEKEMFELQDRLFDEMRPNDSLGKE